MDDTAIAAAVAALIAGRAEKRAIAGLPEGARPSTPAEAYAIQDALIPALLEQAGGGAVIGYKAGATNPAAMANFLLDEPFRGYLLSSLTHDSGVTLASDACVAPILECEFAFRMGDDLPAAAAPYDLDAVVGAVASVIIAIEVVDVRFTEGLAAGGLQIIADQGANGYFIQGSERARIDDIDFDDFPVKLYVDGKLADEGNAMNVMDNPFNSLAWLTNHLCGVGMGLKAGDVVTTGSCTKPLPAAPGQTAVADFGELGKVEVSFAA